MTNTYSDSSIFGKRTYRIEDGFIYVEGKSINGPSFKTRIDLSSVDSNFDQIQFKHPHFANSLIFAIIGIGALIMDRFFWKADLSLFTYLSCGLTVLSIIFCLFFNRQISLVKFKNHAGVPVFDVIEAGPMKSNFQDFISLLQAEIEKKQ